METSIMYHGVAPTTYPANEIQVHEFAHHIDRVCVEFKTTHKLLDDIQPESAGKWGKVQEHLLGLHWQKFKAPGYGRVHGALALWSIFPLAGEDSMAALELREYNFG